MQPYSSKFKVFSERGRGAYKTFSLQVSRERRCSVTKVPRPTVESTGHGGLLDELRAGTQRRTPPQVARHEHRMVRILLAGLIRLGHRYCHFDFVFCVRHRFHQINTIICKRDVKKDSRRVASDALKRDGKCSQD